jgi:hypothetical protein
MAIATHLGRAWQEHANVAPRADTAALHPSRQPIGFSVDTSIGPINVLGLATVRTKTCISNNKIEKCS